MERSLMSLLAETKHASQTGMKVSILLIYWHVMNLEILMDVKQEFCLNFNSDRTLNTMFNEFTLSKFL